MRCSRAVLVCWISDRGIGFCHGPCLALLFGLVGFANAQTGSIAGTATASDGRALRGIVVLRSSQRQPTPPLPRYQSTDDNGAYRFLNVPAGNYTLCMQPIGGQGRRPDEYFLDTCHWNSYGQTISVSAGQAATGVVVTSPIAGILRVHVTDTGGALGGAAPPAQRQPALDPQLRLMLRDANHLTHPLPIVSRSANGRDHATVVPFGVVLSLSIASTRFSVSDASGRAIAGDLPVPAASTAAPVIPININVLGGRP